MNCRPKALGRSENVKCLSLHQDRNRVSLYAQFTSARSYSKKCSLSSGAVALVVSATDCSYDHDIVCDIGCAILQSWPDYGCLY